MSHKLVYGSSLALGALSLVLLFADIALIDSNRHMQENANARQADINKAASLSSINQGLVQALAEAAVNENDSAIKDLLAGQGITINPKASKK
jgi:hypothetical protein